MSTATVLQDENKDMVKLQFHHYEKEDIHLAAGGTREGTVCIIKEPWFALLAADSYGIRVDHVSDVVWLPREDSRVPPTWRTQDDAIVKTAKQWKDSGNKAFEMGKLHKAVEW